MSRTSNSAKNAIVSVIGQFAQVLLQFLCRSVFIKTLAKEYLGLSGLFSNILSVLSLAELGFGTALIYSLYKPVYDNDEKMIVQLTNLYKKIYRIIAGIIVLSGICLLPFLRYLIKDYDTYQGLENLSVIYLLYLANTAASYLYIYKKSVLDAYQKSYVYIAVWKALMVLQNIVQMIFLVLTHNFIGYLLIQIAATVSVNMIVSRRTDKMFPYLRTSSKELPDKELRNTIYKNTSAMTMHKFGAVVVNGTDNLILSSLISLVSVAVYSNYSLVITNLNGFIELVFKAVTASVGSLGAEDDKGRLHEVFFTLNFLLFWVYGFSSVCLYVLLNHFITIWIGADFVFPSSVVFVLVLNFYLKGMRVVINIYRDSLGLFYYDRYKPVFEAIVNLAVSVVLARVYGIIGVFIGTAVSMLTVCLWVEPYVLYKYAFKRRMSIFFKKYAIYALFVFAAGWGIDHLCGFIPVTLAGLIIKVIILVLVYHLALLAVFWRSRELAGAIDSVKRVVREHWKEGGAGNGQKRKMYKS